MPTRTAGAGRNQPLRGPAPGGERIFAQNLMECSADTACLCDLFHGRRGRQLYTLRRIFVTRVSSRDNKRFVRMDSTIQVAPDHRVTVVNCFVLSNLNGRTEIQSRCAGRGSVRVSSPVAQPRTVQTRSLRDSDSEPAASESESRVNVTASASNLNSVSIKGDCSP